MDDCWGGNIAGIKIMENRYDHIDLWDGNTLEIYKKEHSPATIAAFVRRSKAVWFWQLN